jgi:hypothetical protein
VTSEKSALRPVCAVCTILVVRMQVLQELQACGIWIDDVSVGRLTNTE